MVVMVDADRLSDNLLGHALYEQVLSGSPLCDVTVRYYDTEQRFHWCVLLTCPYFEALYRSGIHEKKRGVLLLSEGSSEAIESAMKFLYMGHIDLNMHHVSEILHVADFLQISGLKECCFRFLYQQRISVDNCVQLCHLAASYELHELYALSADIMVFNMENVLQTEGAMTMSPDSVLSIVEDVNLEYVSVQQLFSFIMNWTDCDVTARLKYFSILFLCLKLENFTPEFYRDNVRNHMYVALFAESRNYINNFEQKLLSGDVHHEPANKTVYFIAGAASGFYMSLVETCRLLAYVPYDDKWLELQPLPIRYGAGSLFAMCDGHVFATEKKRFGQNEHLLHMVKYDPRNRRWSDLVIYIPYWEKNRNFTILSLTSVADTLYAVTKSRTRNQESIHLYVIRDSLPPAMAWRAELYVGNCNFCKCHTAVVRNQHICFLGEPNSDLETDVNHEPVFCLYDTQTKDSTHERPSDVHHVDIMLCDEEKLVLINFHSRQGKTFNVETKRWLTEDKFGLPHLPRYPDRVEFSHIWDKTDKCLYIFGGKDMETKKLLTSSYKYNLTNKEWTEIKRAPCEITASGIEVGILPSKALICPVNCNHCKRENGKLQYSFSHLPYGRIQNARDNGIFTQENGEE